MYLNNFNKKIRNQKITLKQVRANLPKDEYIWCLHCERADTYINWLNNYGYCTYSGCSGSLLDAWEWSEIRKYNNYEQVPKHKKYYPMYLKL